MLAHRSVKIMRLTILGVTGLLALQTAPLWSQVRKLHTRDLTRLSQVQVADYLKRSDIIFIPVGAVETNGIMPSDRDYVSPLGVAIAMADELDALYMPGLPWSYPGTTMIAPATVNISPSQPSQERTGRPTTAHEYSKLFYGFANTTPTKLYSGKTT